MRGIEDRDGRRLRGEEIYGRGYKVEGKREKIEKRRNVTEGMRGKW